MFVINGIVFGYKSQIFQEKKTGFTPRSHADLRNPLMRLRPQPRSRFDIRIEPLLCRHNVLRIKPLSANKIVAPTAKMGQLGQPIPWKIDRQRCYRSLCIISKSVMSKVGLCDSLYRHGSWPKVQSVKILKTEAVNVIGNACCSQAGNPSLGILPDGMKYPHHFEALYVNGRASTCLLSISSTNSQVVKRSRSSLRRRLSC